MDNGASSYRRFLDGDKEGLVDLTRLYRDGLTLYLMGFTRDVFAAEELAEEVFVRLVVKRPRFTGKSSFKTWLYSIGRNAALDSLRRRARLRESPLEDVEQSLAEEETLERSYLREERRIQVHRCLKRLNRDYRQALVLVYLEGFDNAGAAAVMGKSKRQIENLLYNAKRALRQELEKEGFHYENL